MTTWTAAKIRKAREARLWSAHDLAQMLGVTGPAVLNWERGRNKPTPKNQKALTAIFATEPAEMELPVTLADVATRLADLEAQVATLVRSVEAGLKGLTSLTAALARIEHLVPGEAAQ